MSEGELKKKVWANSDVDTAEIKESVEYTADARKRHRTDIITIDNVFDILDEAKKEYPSVTEIFNFETHTINITFPDKWFKKWFGDK
jgi:hypothetical protein